MGFLLARRSDGFIRQFEKDELAYFFPSGWRRLLGAQPRLFVEYEIVVFGDLNWFIGLVDKHDYALDHPASYDNCSLQYPTAPHARLQPFYPAQRLQVPPEGQVIRPCPTMAVAEQHHCVFAPKGLFSEISEADAIEWLYKHLGHVPIRAQAALEKVRRAALPSGSQAASTDPIGQAVNPADEPLEAPEAQTIGKNDRKKFALYRKIVAAGDTMGHGAKGKRIKLAQTFEAKIAVLAPGVEPGIFVNRAFAYCLKHPSKTRRR